MPGYSSECVSNAHSACADNQCRCRCHPWVQDLERKAKEQFAPRAVEAVPQIQNVCPSCGYKAIPTDTFCRRDGTKLLLGKRCIRCGAPGHEEDNYCQDCAWKYGEPLPVEQSPQPESEKEDPLIRLKRQAVEMGLLKETAV